MLSIVAPKTFPTMQNAEKHTGFPTPLPTVALLCLVILAGSSYAAESPAFIWPGGRQTFLSGEKAAVWLHLPPHVSGKAQVLLNTSAGTVATVEETVKSAASSATLAYWINTSALAPGGYMLAFRIGDAACESSFTVAGSLPATSFPIATAAPPKTDSDVARCRDLGFNTALIDDAASIDGTALASAGMRWFRELAVKPGTSPADAATVAGGTIFAQLAAQATRSAPGFSGIVIRELPPLPQAGDPADSALAAAYQQQSGTLPPSPADALANFDAWHRYQTFRKGLWPAALQTWCKAVKDVDPALSFAVAAPDAPHTAQEPPPAFLICRIKPGPLGALQALFDLAVARENGGPDGIWAMPPARDISVGQMRTLIFAALAGGAAGIAYPADAAQRHEYGISTEITCLNRTLTRHGELLRSLAPRRARVAVLHSQVCESFSAGRNAAATAQDDYRGRVAAAWAACTLAGAMPDLITEEGALTARDAKYALIIAPGLSQLPRNVAEALADFIDQGGAVIADAAGQVEIKGMTRLPFAFTATNASAPSAEMIDAARNALQRFCPPDTATSRADFIATELAASGTERFFYVFRLSDAPGAQTAEVSLPASGGAIYDVFASREADVRLAGPDGKQAIVRVTLAPGQARLLAMLPSRIGSVKVATPSVDDRTLSIAATLLNGGQALLKASASAEVVVFDESGAERWRLWRRFSRGKLDLALPMAMNEPPGRWSVRVTELFSRQSHATAFTMPKSDAGNVVSAIDSAEIFNRPRCAELLKKSRTLALIAGDAPGTSAAQELARRLQRLNIRCDVLQDKSVARGNAFALPSNAILFGSPPKNALVRQLQAQGLLPIRTGGGHIGAGRAIIFWTLSAFCQGVQTITVWPADSAGYAHATDCLALLAADREPEPARFPATTVVEPVSPPRPPAPEVPDPAFSLQLDDAITGIATPASGRFVLVSSLAGQLRAFTAQGQNVWQQVLPCQIRGLILPANATDSIVLGDLAAMVFSIVSEPKLALPIPGKPGGDAIGGGCSSPDGSAIFVCTDAGKVIAFSGGKVAWKRPMDGPVTALACFKARAAAADAKRIIFANETGGALFKLDFPECSALSFSADGSSLVAGGRTGVVRSFALPTGTVQWERTLPGPVRGIVQPANGRTIAVLDDGSVLEPAGTTDAINLSLGHTVHLLAQAPDRSCFAAASPDGRLSVVNAEGKVRAFRVSDAPISALAIAAGGKLIAAGDWAGTVRVLKFR